jgi:predicted choloylglycine hydrolase
MHTNERRARCALAALIAAVSPVPAAAQGAADRAAVVSEKTIAGGPQDALLVRHLLLRGSNEAIGRALTAIAKERYLTAPPASADPFRARVQRRYIEKSYPILYERMRGVAAAFGKRVDDDAFNFSGLSFVHIRAGCSVVYFPPATTATGSGLLSRNYDFSTGTLEGRLPPPDERGATAHPYVLELHPDRGHASIAMTAYDLLNGAIDGINSEGLTVALLADDELMSKYEMEGTGEKEAVGLGVLQTVRLLLDTCATVAEAKEALLTQKQYYEFIPVHYLVADRHGDAFVWEYSPSHNREYIVEDPGRPLVTTNFSLHRHLEEGRPPSIAKARDLCPRYCALLTAIGEPKAVTVDVVKEAHRAVDATRPARAGMATGRTLWHALYEPEKRTVQISFYLRDETGADGKPRIVRSDYLPFALATDGKGR